MIWLLEKDQLVLQAATGWQSAGLRLRLDQTLAGQAVLERRPVSALFPSEELAREYPDLPILQGQGSALIVPLFASPDGQGSVGAFSVLYRAGDLRDFAQSDWDRKVLDILGHYAALAVQLAQPTRSTARGAGPARADRSLRCHRRYRRQPAAPLEQ